MGYASNGWEKFSCKAQQHPGHRRVCRRCKRQPLRVSGAPSSERCQLAGEHSVLRGQVLGAWRGARPRNGPREGAPGRGEPAQTGGGAVRLGPPAVCMTAARSGAGPHRPPGRGAGRPVTTGKYQMTPTTLGYVNLAKRQEAAGASAKGNKHVLDGKDRRAGPHA